MSAPAAPSPLLFDFMALPLVTPGFPAVPGVIRAEASDFVVDELPLYACSGEGDFLYLRLRKTDMATPELVSALARGLGVSSGDVGAAGLKDRRAVTSQWLSMPPGVSLEAARDVLATLPGVELLEHGRHTNKLGMGHLAGNRFAVRVRGAEGRAEAASAVLAELVRRGAPNYYGPQRFGRFGDNAVAGKALLEGGRYRKQKWLDQLKANALQSFVFNAWLARRLERGLYDAFLPGDVAMKHVNGAKFRVADPAAEGPRALALEISPAGPMPGKKCFPAEGEGAAFEAEVLAELGLTGELFARLPGSRREARVPVAEARIEACPDGFRAHFTLPAGAFATSVLREILKRDPDADAGEAL